MTIVSYFDDSLQEKDELTTADGKILIIEILRWLAAKEQMRLAKANESELRANILGKLLVDGPRRGSMKFEDENFKIQATAKVNIAVDEEVLNALWEDGQLTPEDTAMFSQKLKVSDKIHTLPQTSSVWKAITSKPGTPTLSVTRKDDDGD